MYKYKFPRLVITCASAVLLLVACGDGDPPQGPTETGEAANLDFSAIAGTWSGWAIASGPAGDESFWVSFELDSEALEQEKVGTIEEGLERGTTLCTGELRALEAEDPVFTVREIIASGRCPDADMRLRYDPEEGTVRVDWTPPDPNVQASGVMTRGSDPGPES